MYFDLYFYLLHSWLYGVLRKFSFFQHFYIGLLWVDLFFIPNKKWMKYKIKMELLEPQLCIRVIEAKVVRYKESFGRIFSPCRWTIIKATSKHTWLDLRPAMPSCQQAENKNSSLQVPEKHFFFAHCKNAWDKIISSPPTTANEYE